MPKKGFEQQRLKLAKQAKIYNWIGDHLGIALVRSQDNVVGK